MIVFDRFWMEGIPGYLDEDADPEATDGNEMPGVDVAAIRTWEAKHGVTLPEPIRTALQRRNGGYVRNASIEILPLEEIVPAGDDFWEFAEVEEAESGNHDLMFVFGNETEVGGTYLMNFNARGPKGAPSVYLDLHGESTYRMNDSLAGLFEEALASSAVPNVNWSETEDLSVVARESIDLSSIYRGKPASLDQVLARTGKTLVLFTRQRSAEGEVLTRTVLPLPLDSMWAEVGSRRPTPIGTCGLHLQPEVSDGILEERSETNDDGRWKNSTQHGVPIYVTFESTDRERLVSLREQLFGKQEAARAQAKQDRQAALEQRLEALSPEQRTATMLQAALSMKEKLDREFASQVGDAGGMPADFAKMTAIIQQKMQEIVKKANDKIAANPPDAHALEQIDGIFREFDGD